MISGFDWWFPLQSPHNKSHRKYLLSQIVHHVLVLILHVLLILHPILLNPLTPPLHSLKPTLLHLVLRSSLSLLERALELLLLLITLANVVWFPCSYNILTHTQNHLILVRILNLKPIHLCLLQWIILLFAKGVSALTLWSILTDVEFAEEEVESS
jgi:hypothetical protein